MEHEKFKSPQKLLEQYFTKEMVKDTLKYQKIYGFKIGENNKAVDNEADAFRHTYMQAYLSLKYGGYTTAKYLGDKHEKKLDNGQYSKSSNMDLWNNEQGRQIADEIRKEFKDYKSFSEDKLKDIIACKVVQK